MSDDDGNRSITDDEVMALMLAIVKGHNGIPTPEEVLEAEIKHVVHWAHRTRMDAVLLQLVLDGRVLIGVQEGEISFHNPAGNQ